MTKSIKMYITRWNERNQIIFPLISPLSINSDHPINRAPLLLNCYASEWPGFNITKPTNHCHWVFLLSETTWHVYQAFEIQTQWDFTNIVGLWMPAPDKGLGYFTNVQQFCIYITNRFKLMLFKPLGSNMCVHYTEIHTLSIQASRIQHVCALYREIHTWSIQVFSFKWTFSL